MHVRRPSPALAPYVPVELIVFDLLLLDGFELVARPVPRHDPG
jgi:ATP-dependent DNA ligase